MSLLITLDASVVVSACRKSEPGHKASRELLEKIKEKSIPLILPYILLVEVTAALVRTGTPAALAEEYTLAVSNLPLTTFVSLDKQLSRRATHIAAKHKLRGADAIYVTSANLYGSRLVSLDKEQLFRSPVSVQAMKPAVALSKLFG